MSKQQSKQIGALFGRKRKRIPRIWAHDERHFDKCVLKDILLATFGLLKAKRHPSLLYFELSRIETDVLCKSMPLIQPVKWANLHKYKEWHCASVAFQPFKHEANRSNTEDGPAPNCLDCWLWVAHTPWMLRSVVFNLPPRWSNIFWRSPIKNG